MNAFLSLLSALRSLAPIVGESIKLAEEAFPSIAGSDKLNFVLGMIESNYPESASQHATFEAVKPVLISFIAGAVSIFRKYNPAFKSAPNPEAPTA